MAKFTVDKEHTNLNGTLHGGLTATLVDSISTVALVTTEPHLPGVSTDLNVSYVFSVLTHYHRTIGELLVIWSFLRNIISSYIISTYNITTFIISYVMLFLRSAIT